MPLSLSRSRREEGSEGSRQTCGETNTPQVNFPLVYNDLLGMGLPAGLIWGLDPSDPSSRRDRDRLNGIEFATPSETFTIFSRTVSIFNLMALRL
jgi:hypothetical protein